MKITVAEIVFVGLVTFVPSANIGHNATCYDFSKYWKLMKNSVIYDDRNLYKISEVKKYNIKYYPIGIDVERMDFNVQI